MANNLHSMKIVMIRAFFYNFLKLNIILFCDHAYSLILMDYENGTMKIIFKKKNIYVRWKMVSWMIAFDLLRPI